MFVQIVLEVFMTVYLRSLLAIFFIGLSSEVMPDSTAKFSCVVTDYVILISKEGKSGRAAGYQDSFRKGDSLQILMTLSKQVGFEPTYDLEIKLLFGDDGTICFKASSKAYG